MNYQEANSLRDLTGHTHYRQDECLDGYHLCIYVYVSVFVLQKSYYFTVLLSPYFLIDNYTLLTRNCVVKTAFFFASHPTVCIEFEYHLLRKLASFFPLILIFSSANLTAVCCPTGIGTHKTFSL